MIGKLKNVATALMRPKPSPSVNQARPLVQRDVFDAPRRGPHPARQPGGQASVQFAPPELSASSSGKGGTSDPGGRKGEGNDPDGPVIV